MCRRGAPCGCGQSGPAGWLLPAAALVAAGGAAAVWAWELAALAAGTGLLITAACCIGIQAGKRRMILVWRPAALSQPVTVVSVRAVRSQAEVADRERAAIEGRRIEGSTGTGPHA